MNIEEATMSCFSITKSSLENENVSLSLLFNLANIQDKVHQIQSLASFFIISNNQSSDSTSCLPVANIETLVQEIITISSSMMFTCQQLHMISSNKDNDIGNDKSLEAMVMEIFGQQTNPSYVFMQEPQTNIVDVQERGQILLTGQNLDSQGTKTLNPKKDRGQSKQRPRNCEILEIEAADLLTKYTHYCKICAKGFKRDANLRMHMRSHGDEYKTREALISPKTIHDDDDKKLENSLKKHYYYYSCPKQGCRWNQRHDKFQPLKSAICAKNHYKRCHCPKMYMCKRCNVKNFSVLSDLRTHEKHCGDIKWVCSCGTRFSRKDKLASHVSLFLGHSPAHEPIITL
ncbi:unnamed protein product [Cochlearia groenlandica]